MKRGFPRRIRCGSAQRRWSMRSSRGRWRRNKDGGGADRMPPVPAPWLGSFGGDPRVFSGAGRDGRGGAPFAPLAPPRVTLYTCGPTVWNYAHIGNFRTFLFEDLLRRYLAYSGYDVFHIMNLTDVDDRTIKAAAAAGKRLEAHT